jgi:hypothetical protein
MGDCDGREALSGMGMGKGMVDRILARSLVCFSSAVVGHAGLWLWIRGSLEGSKETAIMD